MLHRRHLASLAVPAAAALAAPGRARARAMHPPPRRLHVRVASPAAQERFEALARRVAEASGGEFRLAAGAGAARGEGATGVFGGLAFGRVSLGASLEPFAGFPFGMGPLEVADWLVSRDGAALWSSAFSLRRALAFPSGIAVFPGWLVSARAVAKPADFSGLRVACRADGVLGSALRDLSAAPVEYASEASLPAVRCAGAGPADSAPRPRPGAEAERRPHRYRLCPAFGSVIELAVPAAGLRALGPRFLAAIEQACAAEFDASLSGLDDAGVQGRVGPALAPAAIAESVAACTASRLRERLGHPEAVALRVAERFNAARLARLRFDAWR